MGRDNNSVVTGARIMWVTPACARSRSDPQPATERVWEAKCALNPSRRSASFSYVNTQEARTAGGTGRERRASAIRQMASPRSRPRRPSTCRVQFRGTTTLACT